MSFVLPVTVAATLLSVSCRIGALRCVSWRLAYMYSVHMGPVSTIGFLFVDSDGTMHRMHGSARSKVFLG